MQSLNGEIINNVKLGDGLFKMEIFSPYLVKHSYPGQFINIKCSPPEVLDPLLRRPFSIYDIEEDFNVASILYLVRGKGTRYLSKLQKGNELDYCGPLGNPLNIDGEKKVLLVGGGIGVAPLYFIAKQLSGRGREVSFMCGFKESNFRIWEKDLMRLSISYQIFCEDGMWGSVGMVTEGLEDKLGQFKGFRVYCCGPQEMLRNLQEIFKGKDIEVTALLEEKMACGTGVCMGCAIKVRKGSGFVYKRVCSDGPAFNLAEVIFD